VSPPPTYRLVLDGVEEQIVADAPQVGDHLPPERICGCPKRRTLPVTCCFVASGNPA